MATQHDSSTPHPNHSSESASSTKPWKQLCEMLGADSPDAVVTKVRMLRAQTNVPDPEAPHASSDGLVSVYDVEEVLQRMQHKLETLRDRNAALLERLEAEGSASEMDTLHVEVNQLMDNLDVNSLEEVQARVESLQRQVETLYDEKERLAAAGWSSTEEALDEIHALQERLNEAEQTQQALRERVDRLTKERATLKEQVDTLREERDALRTRSIDKETRALLDATTSVLGIRTPEEARNLAQKVRGMQRHLDDLLAAKEQITAEVGVDTADDLLDMITNMEQQLVDLYEQRDQGDATLPKVIEDTLGVSNAAEVDALAQTVRRMSDNLHVLSNHKKHLSNETGLEDADDILTMIQSLEEQLAALYEEREADLEASSAASDAVLEEIQHILGAHTPDEARALREQLHRMGTHIHALLETPEPAATHESSSHAPTMRALIDTMEEQLVDLYLTVDEEENDALENDALDNPPSSTAVTDEVHEILGVTTPEQARELEALVHNVTARMEHLAQEQEKLQHHNISDVDAALAMIDSMEEQLVDLYRNIDRSEASSGATPASALVLDDAPEVAEALNHLGKRLGAPPAQASTLMAGIQALSNHTNTLLDAGNASLQRDGQPPAEQLDDLIDRTSDRLRALKDERNTLRKAKRHLHHIREALNVSTAKDASQLSKQVLRMKEQLDILQTEQERLEELGVRSVADAIDMVNSMQQQLQEMYMDKENVQRRVDRHDMGQDNFEQLEAFYAEQELLEREIGVSSADAIVEMVQGLSTQLMEVYSMTEGRPYDEWTTGDDGESLNDEDTELMMQSMQEQLDAFYEAKELLFAKGMTSIDEAVAEIETLERRIQQLQREQGTYQLWLRRIESIIGTDDLDKLVSRVRLLKERALKDAGSSTDASGTQRNASGDGTGFVFQAAPQFAERATLEQLDALDSTALDALPYGVIKLSDQGRIQFVNENALSLPGLKEADNQTTLTGKNFFDDLAPSTKNSLFLGRFKKGVQQKAMDACFPYTFISPGRAPVVLTVHLYRSSDERANWLLFEAM